MFFEVPRNRAAVKTISPKSLLNQVQAVDLHFHGAFGVDLSSAPISQLDWLTQRLWKAGMAAFCPTTVSSDWPQLKETVQRLGQWITQFRAHSGDRTPKTRPLGIHLEGPYLNTQCCGAHPPQFLRPFQLSELKELWELSQKTIRIVTLAPEALSKRELLALTEWAKPRRIRLSIGHSQATQEQATRAFDSGFSQVTHAWNALNFHQRAPGVLGAALGNPNVWIELILDQVHVHPTVIDWTLKLHPRNRICFVSDCVTAAGMPANQWFQFGPLKVRNVDGACRLENGALAGGGLLLPEAFRRWVMAEAMRTGDSKKALLKRYAACTSSQPARIER